MSAKESVNILLFNKWDTRKIEVNDLGLQKVISLKPAAVIPITFGRHEHQRLKKAEVNIIERFANKYDAFWEKICKEYRKNGRQKGEGNEYL